MQFIFLSNWVNFFGAEVTRFGTVAPPQNFSKVRNSTYSSKNLPTPPFSGTAIQNFQPPSKNSNPNPVKKWFKLFCFNVSLHCCMKRYQLQIFPTPPFSWTAILNIQPPSKNFYPNPTKNGFIFLGENFHCKFFKIFPTPPSSSTAILNIQPPSKNFNPNPTNKGYIFLEKCNSLISHIFHSFHTYFTQFTNFNFSHFTPLSVSSHLFAKWKRKHEK